MMCWSIVAEKNCRKWIADTQLTPRQSRPIADDTALLRCLETIVANIYLQLCSINFIKHCRTVMHEK
jgi:hypothetical protein